MKFIHVAAAVIVNRAGEVLLALRPEDKHQGGLWEFPGGKVEPGETALEALDRELHEELGIRVLAAEPLISVPQAYPGKRIVLDVHTVGAFEGTPRGLERQALAWAPLATLASYTMPPADRPVVAALTAPDRYLVTPETVEPAAFLARLDRALATGVRRVQLRVRGLPADQMASLARDAATRCRTRGAELLVNGEAGLAADLGLGLHLPTRDLMALSALPVLAPGQRVAASCHDADQLARAEQLGVHFAVLGPVLATQSHPGATPLGWDRFSRLREGVSLPIYAIGGMKPSDLAVARRHGAQGVAGIRGLWPR